MEDKKLKAKIKEMELKKREQSAPAAPAAPADTVVSFDSWYHQRSSSIPSIHKKEIIHADFKARGLVEEATMEDFDKALKLYGITLK